MKFALISSITKPTTLSALGGTEVWNSLFALENSKRGHQIDIYAIANSLTNEKIKLIETLPQPRDSFLKDLYFQNIDEIELVKRSTQFTSTVYAKILRLIKMKEEEYDLIIDSALYPTFTANVELFKKKVLIIGHFPIDFSLNFYINTFGLPQNGYFIFPSYYQFNHSSFIPKNQKKVIPHGISLSNLFLNQTPEYSMVWVGRIHYMGNKGLEEAIKTALLTKRRLEIYGTLERTAISFFNQKIRPNLKSELINLITTSKNDKNIIFGNKKLFLFPIQWEEPFGLVMIESMACGTPVVAFARGSVPEVVKDGETGFIVNPSDEDKRGDWIVKKTGIEGLCEAVERIYSMPEEQYKKMRRACRAHVEKNFTVERMVDEYEKVYQQIVNTKKH